MKKQITSILAGFIDAYMVHFCQHFRQYRDDDAKTNDINQ